MSDFLKNLFLLEKPPENAVINTGTGIINQSERNILQTTSFWSTLKKYLKWFYVAILITFGFVGTVLSGPVTYNDVSSNPEYSKLINTEYRTTGDLYIYGVTMDRKYTKILDYYDITEVNFGGPEVLSKDVLEKGTLLKIKRVEKTTNFLVKLQNMPVIKYTVDINPLYENNQKLTYIDSDTLSSRLMGTATIVSVIVWSS